MELIQRLISILSSKRAEDYSDWIHVAWALHNTSPALYNDFVKFSKLCPDKYDERKCKKVWNEAKNSGLTIASLYWWAKSDNPEAFVEILRERMKDLLLKAGSGTHTDVANVIYEMYKYQYKCIGIKNKVWYEFQGSLWVMIEEGYTLLNKMSTEVMAQFMKLHQLLMHEADLYDREKRDIIIEQGKRIQKLYDKLLNVSFKDQVLKECSRMFYDTKFEEKLNSNLFLLGFDNGVYDLQHRCFREGSPDDYISKTVGYNYTEYTFDSPEVKEVEEFFDKVQTEEDMRNFILTSVASFLDGSLEAQQFYIWTGSGCHARNTKICMFEGKNKCVQNIDVGDLLLGDDGRERKVRRLFRGKEKLYKVKLEDGFTFRVNGKHRIALKCNYKMHIEEFDDDIYNKKVYYVCFYENFGFPILMKKKFNEKEKAKKFMKNMKNKCIQDGEIIPVYAEDLCNNMDGLENDWINDFKMPKTDGSVCVIKMIRSEEEENEYFGFEIDGNKRYVMKGGYITYNSNGKSVTVDLINKTLGDYAGVLPITVLTRKQGNSGSATPELADKKGIRFLAIQEPEHDDVMHLGLMKVLTSGADQIPARALYGNPFKFQPQFKIVLPCNKLPIVPSSDDGGAWRRICVGPWESKFVDHPSGAKEFLKDPTLLHRVGNWNKPFMWLLLNKYYPMYIDHGLVKPDRVQIKTQEYRTDNDRFQAFFVDYIDEKGAKDHNEEFDYVYNVFKTWYWNTYSVKAPNGKEFRKCLENKGYIIERRVIKGITLLLHSESSSYFDDKDDKKPENKK
jgi:phage/plasmid-associated DNA primase